MKILFSLLLVIAIQGGLYSQTSSNVGTPFGNKLKFVGVAVSEPGYHIWCTSPIFAEDGKVHLFVSRWPKQYNVDPGWRSHSEIAHYISDKPEGPFKFQEVVIKGDSKSKWAKYGACNPVIKKIGDYYALYYIANDNYKQPPHPANQNIGLVVSKSLNGPWVKAGEDGKILGPSNNPKNWTYKAKNGVVNPAVLEHPDGGIFMYFKSNNSKMGLAIAQDLAGPYVQYPSAVTKNNTAIEDGYAFVKNGEFCLLTTDNHGILEKGGGILWKSKDGLNFDTYECGFHTMEYYLGKENLKDVKLHYGPNLPKFERPQLLFKDGKPSYLYVASGSNIYGGDSTISYVLKIEE